MEIYLGINGEINKTIQDSWADKNLNVVHDTYFCSDLKIALKARNRRKKELHRQGFSDIACQPLIDDSQQPFKTVGYIITAYK